MQEYFHSVRLDEEKCKGCTNCIKGCPTEAIRVKKSKAKIIDERCIDCGECIRVCPHHAKKAITDDLSMLANFKHKIVIPAPMLYGQFKKAKSRNHLLTALLKLGFDEVFEVAKAAEIVSRATIDYIINEKPEYPVISTACPAVVKLIQVRFPSLIENLLPLDAPMELAAMMAKDRAEANGIKREDIGVAFISPCAAKMTATKTPFGKIKSEVDIVLSVKDIFLPLRSILGNLKDDEVLSLSESGFEGIRWANSGGESLALHTDQFLAVDGVHDIIHIFEEIENGNIEDVKFVEALSCGDGCIGGPLVAENVYVAKTVMKKIIDEAKTAEIKKEPLAADFYKKIMWTEDLEYKPVMKLDEDMLVAMQKMDEMERIEKELPGLDCGACGAPRCRALAEDIVRGKGNQIDCIFKLRERVKELAIEMLEMESLLPPVMDKEVNHEST